MSKPSSILFSAATRALFLLKEQSGHFSHEIYARWKELLPEIFFQYYTESEIVQSVSRCHKEKWPQKTLEETVDTLSPDDKLRYTALIDFYLSMVKQRGDLITHRYLHQIRSSCSFVPREQPESNKWVETWLIQREKKSFRTVVYLNVSGWLVAIDFLLRLLALFLIHHKGWNFESKIGSALFANFIMVPSIVLFIGVAYRQFVNKKIQKRLAAMQMSDLKLKPKLTGWHYFAIAILSVTGVGLGELHLDGFTDNSFLLFGLLVLITSMWHYLILSQFSMPLPDSKVIYEKLKEQDKIETQDELDSEENDIEITNLEVRLHSLTDRMNAYVLEAALFGALAFSGFIQIITSEIFTLDSFSEFNTAFIELMRALVNGNMKELQTSFALLNSRNTLLSLLCYESLFCSICFISVIASRLRQSDVADLMQKALRLSQTFNEKENRLEYTALSPKQGLKEKLNKAIKTNLIDAMREYKQITPVLEFMRFFRTLGIFSFFVILITGGLFISPLLSVLFVLIFLLSILYFQFPNIILYYLLAKTSIQDFMASIHRYVMPAFLILSLFILLYRGLNFPGSDFLFLLLIALIVLYQIVMLVEGVSFNYTNATQTRTFRIALIVLLVGIIFKNNQLTGGTLLLVISVILLTYFFISTGFQKGNTLMQRFLGVGIAISVLSIPFKLLNRPGTLWLFLASTSIFIITLTYTHLRNKRQQIPDFIHSASFLFLILSIIGIIFPDALSFLSDFLF